MNTTRKTVVIFTGEYCLKGGIESGEQRILDVLNNKSSEFLEIFQTQIIRFGQEQH